MNWAAILFQQFCLNFFSDLNRRLFWIRPCWKLKYEYIFVQTPILHKEKFQKYWPTFESYRASYKFQWAAMISRGKDMIYSHGQKRLNADSSKITAATVSSFLAMTVGKSFYVNLYFVWNTYYKEVLFLQPHSILIWLYKRIHEATKYCHFCVR